jgi:hypothetical protein
LYGDGRGREKARVTECESRSEEGGIGPGKDLAAWLDLWYTDPAPYDMALDWLWGNGAGLLIYCLRRSVWEESSAVYIEADVI